MLQFRKFVRFRPLGQGNIARDVQQQKSWREVEGKARKDKECVEQGMINSSINIFSFTSWSAVPHNILVADPQFCAFAPYRIKVKESTLVNTTNANVWRALRLTPNSWVERQKHGEEKEGSSRQRDGAWACKVQASGGKKMWPFHKVPGLNAVWEGKGEQLVHGTLVQSASVTATLTEPGVQLDSWDSLCLPLTQIFPGVSERNLAGKEWPDAD